MRIVLLHVPMSDMPVVLASICIEGGNVTENSEKFTAFLPV